MKKAFPAALILTGLAIALLSFPLEAASPTKTEVINTEQCLRVIGWTQNCVYFKANTVVERPMNSTQVISGTLSKDACLRAQGWSDGCAVFKAGTVIRFNDKGSVLTGTLAQDSNLRPVGQGTARTYKAGRTVTFDTTGHVVKETN